MVQVSFEINGKEVKPDSMKDALDILYLDHVRKEIVNRLMFLQCSIHKQEQRVIVKGQNLDTLAYEITGCCTEIINEAQKRIK